RGGRVRSTTPAEDRYIVLSAKKEQAHHSSAVGKSVSCCLRKADLPKSVARRLRGGGLYARRPVVCPIDQTAPYFRLQWCREHHNWTEQDWACAVAGRNYPPTNKNTLIRALTEEWDKLPQQLLDNVVQKYGTTCGMLHHTPQWTYPVLIPFLWCRADF
ncbi:hypothetical protein TNCV_2512331, partial [Trichonephila clavipes]